MSYLRADIPSAGYGKKEVLREIKVEVEKGTIAAFIGPNGAGKSTLLKVIMGLLPVENGIVEFDGLTISGLRPEEIVKAGIGFVPQGNRVFTELTVRENLETGGYLLKKKAEMEKRLNEVVEVFPELRGRQKQNAGQLSGGEKQQLALARALMLKPKVLLLDEPSLGLSPKLVVKAFAEISSLATSMGITLLIVEQKVREALRLADKVYALRMGRIVFEGTSDELQKGDALKKVFLA